MKVLARIPANEVDLRKDWRGWWGGHGACDLSIEASVMAPPPSIPHRLEAARLENPPSHRSDHSPRRSGPGWGRADFTNHVTTAR